MPKRMSLSLVYWLFAAVGAYSDTPALPATNSVIQEAKAKYYARLSEVQRRSAEEASQMPGKYRKALEALEKELQNQGDLQGVIAVRKEKTDFDLDKSLPEKEDPALPPLLTDLRKKYRQQVDQIEDKCNAVILELVQKYAKNLYSIEKQMTKEGKIQEALVIHEELVSVKDREAALSEAIRYSNESASGKETGRLVDNPIPVPVAATGSVTKIGTLLENVIIPSFSFVDSANNDQQIRILNGYINAVYNRGIKVRIAVDRLQVEAVTYVQGVPQYRVRYQPTSGNYQDRRRNFVLNEASARSLLQAICSCYDLAYKIDSANEEVVILDKTAAGAEWMAYKTPVEQLVRDMQTEAGRKQTTGKSILVTGEVAGTMQGLAELTLKLNNKAQLRFPKNSVNLARITDIQGKYNDANKQNRDGSWDQHFVEVTVLGEVGKSNSPFVLTLDNCLILECFSGARPPNRDASSERRVIRLGDPR